MSNLSHFRTSIVCPPSTLSCQRVCVLHVCLLRRQAWKGVCVCVGFRVWAVRLYLPPVHTSTSSRKDTPALTGQTGKSLQLLTFFSARMASIGIHVMAVFSSLLQQLGLPWLTPDQTAHTHTHTHTHTTAVLYNQGLSGTASFHNTIYQSPSLGVFKGLPIFLCLNLEG